jgi:hypothetical protein
MTTMRSIRALLMAAVLVGAAAVPARAQGFEVGTSLASVIVTMSDPSTITFGVPSGGFGLINPGLYVSFFTGPRIAIEPQIGLIAASGGGSSAHVLNLAGQVNCFLRDGQGNSPYVFGSVGVIEATGAGTPTSVSAGVGYRTALAQRLAMRVDGRYLHFTDGGGHALSFTISLGGIFGR